jgi:uncharacterized membrane protein
VPRADAPQSAVSPRIDLLRLDRVSDYGFAPPFVVGGQFTAIVVVNPTFSESHGINNSDDIAGDYPYIVNNQPAHVGYLLTAGGANSFQVPGSRYTYAFGIDDTDAVVGYYVDAGGFRHGYLLTAGQFTTLDVPDAIETQAYGINNAGIIVGFYRDADQRAHGFVLSPIRQQSE